ncbi:MAG TPA: lipoprotein [Xanthomonadales bacterium]|nr:lipoprotein [Xanthomonadales bacterium]
MTFRRLTLLLILISLLAACGQRGPLYLPEEAAEPAASQQAPAEPEEDDEADNEDDDKVHGGGFEDGRDDEP